MLSHSESDLINSNPEKAFALFKKKSRKDPKYHAYIGVFYLLGFGVAKHPLKAYKHLKKAKESGVANPHLFTCFNLPVKYSSRIISMSEISCRDASVLIKGISLKRCGKIEEAKNVLKESFHRIAQYHYATCFKSSPQSTPIEWKCALERSAGQGFLPSIYELAKYHIREKEWDEALEYLVQGVSKNHSGCHYELGMMYVYGRGVERNYTTAYNHFLRGSLNRHIPSMKEVANCIALGRGAKQDKKRASKMTGIVASIERDLAK